MNGESLNIQQDQLEKLKQLFPEIIAKHNHEKSESQKIWSELEKEDIKDKKGRIKNQLNETHSAKITLQHLEKHSAKEEIIKWFTTIAELLKIN